MYRKKYPTDVHRVYTSSFRDELPKLQKPMESSVQAQAPETIEKQKKHPTQLQVEVPPSKRFKFQKG